MSIPQKIIITGTIYIKYEDTIRSPLVGDILLLLNDDAITPFAGYEGNTLSGYFKAKIYDGKVWQNIDIVEFCQNRENKFSKKQRPIDSAYLCRDIIKEYKSVPMFRTYRGHFTLEEYIQGEYIRKVKFAKKEKR